MRTLLLVASLFSVFLQQAQPPGVFPVPKGLQSGWPGAGLSPAQMKALERAMAPDFEEWETECETRPQISDFDMAPINMRKLGQGLLVRATGACICGATGNCPIVGYLREANSFRKILGGEKRSAPFGWGFGLLRGDAEIPEIVLASNLGGGTQVLTLYRYSGRKFESATCETLTQKEDGDGMWEPYNVIVKPCEQRRPAPKAATKPSGKHP